MDERERTIRNLLPIVRAIAKRIHRLVPIVALDDLVGDGSVGLIRAVDAYDPSYGTTLETYARRLILGNMLNGVRRMDPVNERARRELREAQRQRYEIAASSGSLPSLNEMCAARPHLRAALRQVHEAVPFSLDRRLPDDAEEPLDAAADPALIVDARLDLARLQRMVRRLNPRYRALLMRHYYFDESLSHIGRQMAISSQRVSQMHVTALRHLRKMHDAATD